MFKGLLSPQFETEKRNTLHQKLTIIFYLIDLLLGEAQIFDNSSKMQEINGLITQAAEMAQQAPRALIQIYFVQAKILLIEGEVDESISLLDKAYTLATSKKMNLLSEKAKTLQLKVQDEITKWKSIIDSNV
ncbi:MAG: hypothetical protein KAT16_06005, partial [Candidatus Heimdallarchaeota archaeon]|nr:hypothetical protein [Candidatus Heimdallarchaeota archaeon]